ncbi:MAG TPA: hypothetical protein PL161_10920, partial [Spirochaetota bacterium]|nr:hypothetical protein [Spirochaetota bacterium]
SHIGETKLYEDSSVFSQNHMLFSFEICSYDFSNMYLWGRFDGYDLYGGFDDYAGLVCWMQNKVIG